MCYAVPPFQEFGCQQSADHLKINILDKCYVQTIKGVIVVSTQRLIVHLIEIKLHQPDLLQTQKYHSKDQTTRFAQPSTILHENKNRVRVLFGCSTGGLVSYPHLYILYMEDQMSQLIFPFLFKKRNRMSGKTVQ